MRIHIYELIKGAEEARGLTVIIDVFRAFSLETYLFARGADQIYAVGSEETAWRLKKDDPRAILVGERAGKIIDGFAYGNSPYQTKDIFMTASDCYYNQKKLLKVIHTTSAGTQGLVHAIHADQILTGSLVNARAIARYIKRQDPKEVSLVAMGLSGKKSSAEDLLCARYIKSLICEEDYNLTGEIIKLRKDSQAQKFFCTDTQDIFSKRRL